MIPPEQGPEFTAAIAMLRTDPPPWAPPKPDGFTVQRMTKDAVRPVLNHAGISVLQYTHYMWFARAVGRALHHTTGARLADQLELLLVRWIMHGLDPVLLQKVALAALARYGYNVRCGGGA